MIAGPLFAERFPAERLAPRAMSSSRRGSALMFMSFTGFN